MGRPVEVEDRPARKLGRGRGEIQDRRRDLVRRRDAAERVLRPPVAALLARERLGDAANRRFEEAVRALPQVIAADW